MKVWASELFKSPEWQDSARTRIIEGKAPHLEAHCLQVLMPKTDKTQISAAASLAELLGVTKSA